MEILWNILSALAGALGIFILLVIFMYPPWLQEAVEELEELVEKEMGYPPRN